MKQTSREQSQPEKKSPQLARQMQKISEKIEKLQAHNALLRTQDDNRRLSFINGMSQLVQSASYRQDDITSMQPLITANQYAVITLNYNILMFMYSTHGLIQTAIDQPVLDAFKDPIGLICKTLSPRNLEELEQWWEENAIEEPKNDTLTWGRLFGGAAAVINVAGDPRQPLDLKEVERGRFAVYPAARWELGGTWRYSDSYNFYGMDFDKSRVITVIGKRMPWILERQLSGWGASLIARMAEDFNVYLRTRNALYETINEFKIDVYKMKGYNEQLLTQQGTAAVDARIAMTNSLKYFHQAIIIDAEDDYVIKQSVFTGIAEVMRENRMGLVAATRIPVEKLFGESQKGALGGGGEDAMENYNSMVTSEVRRPARPLIKKLLSLGAAAIFGGKHYVDFEYPPLRTMDAKTEEEVKTSKHTRILADLEAGLIDEGEAAAWMHREKLLPFTTNLAKRGMKKTGMDVPDAKARKEKTKTQGADHAKREGSGVAGDARQVPKYG